MPLVDDIGIHSPNLLKLFQDCPIKFYYRYIEQIPSVLPDKNFETGKNIHALASYYLKGSDVSDLERVLNQNEKEMWEYLKNNNYFKFETVGIEKNISVKLDEFWIGGRIDSIVKNGEDYYILDYKTGSISDDMTYDIQTMVYLLLCDEMFKSKNSLSFVYLDLKKKREVKTILTEDLRKEYELKLLDLCNRIKHFNLKKCAPKENCTCEYSKICKSQNSYL